MIADPGSPGPLEEVALLHYRSTGNLAIRPCEICGILVLHEEGAPTAYSLQDGGDAQPWRWRPFPHNAPGGPSCIGGGPAARAMRRTSFVATGMAAHTDDEPA